MKKILLSAAALMVLFAACKKDDDKTTSRKDMLVGTWKSTEYGIDANGNGIKDAAETAPTIDSLLKILVTLNSNGSGTAISSTFLGNDTSTFNWSLTNSDNTLRTIDGTDTADLSIKELTSSKVTFLEDSTWLVMQKQ